MSGVNLYLSFGILRENKTKKDSYSFIKRHECFIGTSFERLQDDIVIISICCCTSTTSSTINVAHAAYTGSRSCSEQPIRVARKTAATHTNTTTDVIGKSRQRTAHIIVVVVIQLIRGHLERLSFSLSKSPILSFITDRVRRYS